MTKGLEDWYDWLYEARNKACEIITFTKDPGLGLLFRIIYSCLHAEAVMVDIVDQFYISFRQEASYSGKLILKYGRRDLY